MAAPGGFSPQLVSQLSALFGSESLTTTTSSTLNTPETTSTPSITSTPSTDSTTSTSSTASIDSTASTSNTASTDSTVSTDSTASSTASTARSTSSTTSTASTRSTSSTGSTDSNVPTDSTASASSTASTTDTSVTSSSSTSTPSDVDLNTSSFLDTSSLSTSTQLVTSFIPAAQATKSATSATSAPVVINRSNTGAIVGGVVGAAGLICLILLVGFFMCRTRKRKDIADFGPQAFSHTTSGKEIRHNYPFDHGSKDHLPARIERLLFPSITPFTASRSTYDRDNNIAGFGTHYVKSRSRDPINHGATSPEPIHRIYRQPSSSSPDALPYPLRQPSSSSAHAPPYPRRQPSSSSAHAPSYHHRHPSSSSAHAPLYPRRQPSSSSAHAPLYPRRQPSSSSAHAPSYPRRQPSSSSAHAPPYPRRQPSPSSAHAPYPRYIEQSYDRKDLSMLAVQVGSALDNDVVGSNASSHRPRRKKTALDSKSDVPRVLRKEREYSHDEEDLFSQSGEFSPFADPQSDPPSNLIPGYVNGRQSFRTMAF